MCICVCVCVCVCVRQLSQIQLSINWQIICRKLSKLFQTGELKIVLKCDKNISQNFILFSPKFGMFFQLATNCFEVEFLHNFAQKTPKSWLLKTCQSSIKQSTQQKGRDGRTQVLANQVHYKWSPYKQRIGSQIKVPNPCPLKLQEAYQIRRGEECLKKMLSLKEKKLSPIIATGLKIDVASKPLLQWHWHPLFLKWTLNPKEKDFPCFSFFTPC